MPVKTGSSHGLAVLICTVLAAFLIEVLRPALPQVVAAFRSAAVRLVAWLDIPLDPQFVAVTLLGSTLAFVWGAVFRIRQTKR